MGVSGLAEYIQDIVNQIKGFINIEFGFCDKMGTVLGCSNEEKVGTLNENISSIFDLEDDICVIDDYVYQKHYQDKDIDFIVFIKNPNQEAINYINAISVCIINLRKIKESYGNRTDFLKSIILEEIPVSDISSKASELGLVQNVSRAVFLIRLEKLVKSNVYDIIENIFPNEKKDFIVTLDKFNMVLVKELKTGENENLEKIASVIIEALNSEIMVKAYIGISSMFDNLSGIVKAFKEAEMALDIGGVFYRDAFIINFNNLGIVRLIYELPKEFCKSFIDKVFKDTDQEILDQETLLTVNKLFENNLHVSETSRQLFLHRNTLGYRLDKIQKSTGLDLKKFDHAIIFKVALLMWEYLRNNPGYREKTNHDF